MVVQCRECQSKFHVPADKIPPEGTLVRCSKCQSTFWLDLPIPTNSQPPNQALAKDSWFDEPIPFASRPSSSLPSEFAFDIAENPSSNELAPWEENNSVSSHTPIIATNVQPERIPLIQPELFQDNILEPSPPTPNPNAQAHHSILGPEVAPSAGLHKLGENPNPFELLVTDRKQNQKQTLFRWAPRLVRGLCLLLIFGFSTVLWMSLKRGKLSLDVLAPKQFLRLVLGQGQTWKIQHVKLQAYPHHGQTQLLVIRGRLYNNTNRPQSAPNLQLVSTHPTNKILLQSVRCCWHITPRQMHQFTSETQLSRLYQQHNQSKPRQTIAARQAKEFHLLWLLQQPIQRIFVRPIP